MSQLRKRINVSHNFKTNVCSCTQQWWQFGSEVFLSDAEGFGSVIFLVISDTCKYHSTK